MDDIYKNIEEYNPNNKFKILLFFNDMIADMLSNKKINPVVTVLFIRGRKLNISLVFITQCYFALTKNIRLNSKHYFIMKIPNKQELQQNQSWQLMIGLEMKNCNMILTEKQQISTLSSGKIDKYEYLTGEEILPPDQRRVIE